MTIGCHLGPGCEPNHEAFFFVVKLRRVQTSRHALTSASILATATPPRVYKSLYHPVHSPKKLTAYYATSELSSAVICYAANESVLSRKRDEPLRQTRKLPPRRRPLRRRISGRSDRGLLALTRLKWRRKEGNARRLLKRLPIARMMSKCAFISTLII